MSEVIDIQVGRVYEGKKRKTVRFSRYWDDRQVVYYDEVADRVQYDSPTVKFGRRLPIVDGDKFREWAGRDVTHEMPKGEWRTGPY